MELKKKKQILRRGLRMTSGGRTIAKSLVRHPEHSEESAFISGEIKNLQ
jgi:hypothetical protein